MIGIVSIVVKKRKRKAFFGSVLKILCLTAAAEPWSCTQAQNFIHDSDAELIKNISFKQKQ
jgi:hypothetical protein